MTKAGARPRRVPPGVVDDRVAAVVDAWVHAPADVDLRRARREYVRRFMPDLGSALDNLSDRVTPGWRPKRS